MSTEGPRLGRMARQQEDEDASSKAEKRQGSTEKQDKRIDGEKESRKRHENRREAAKSPRKDAKNGQDEVRETSRSSKKKDSTEEKKEHKSTIVEKEERSGGKNKERDGERRGDKKGEKHKDKKETDTKSEKIDHARRSPLEPTEANAVKERASKALLCEVCEHRNAALWCADCGDILYCNKCAEADHSRGKRKEHLPLRPADKAPQRNATKVVRCEEHGETLRAYCETDRKAVCSLCLHIGSHKGHSALDLEKAVRAARESIRKEAGDLILERQKVDTFLDELEDIAESLKKNGGELREHLRSACDSFRAVLAEREAALLVQIDERESEKTSTISRQRVRWKDTVAQVNKARELAEGALKEADPVVLLKKRDAFEQQAHALRIASARRSATPATTASLDLALEADPIISFIRDSVVFTSGGSVNKASILVARLQQAQNQKASLTDNTVIVLPRGCLEVARVTPNLATQQDASAPDAWIGRLWELKEHLLASEVSKEALLELSRTKRRGKSELSGQSSDAAIKAAVKIQARWRGACLRKANSLELLKAFRGCGIRGSVVYAVQGASNDGVDERYVKLLATLGCLVILTGHSVDPPGKRAPILSRRSSSGPSTLGSWLEEQDQTDAAVDQVTKVTAQIHHLSKTLPASIRQSGLFTMGHGSGGELISRVETRGGLRELLTGTITSGCDQPGPGTAGNVLALSFGGSEAASKSADALVAKYIESGLAAVLPESSLQKDSLSNDGVLRELLLTFLCKPQRIHLLDKLWETEPHLAKQLTVTARRGNVLSVSIQPNGRNSHQKRNRAPPSAITPTMEPPLKDEQTPSTNGSKTLERSASVRKSPQDGVGSLKQDDSLVEGERRRQSEAAETKEKRSDGVTGVVATGGISTGELLTGSSSGAGAASGPGTNTPPGGTVDQNPKPNQTAAPSSNPVPGSALPISALPASSALPSSPPVGSSSYSRPLPSNPVPNPVQPEVGQPGSSMSRPSFSSSRLPAYTPGSSYAPVNPPNPASFATPASAYTSAAPLASTFARTGAVDTATARALQQPSATGSYVPGASAGRLGQLGSNLTDGGVLGTSGPPRGGLTK